MENLRLDATPKELPTVTQDQEVWIKNQVELRLEWLYL